ncbi:MAG: AarF/ABC1/UbiB kinase family protein [Sandaracinaceae bacterium]|nr:AarF/ABC1/UbiB kinase family protein [Sandaracinaceae bacterium]
MRSFFLAVGRGARVAAALFPIYVAYFYLWLRGKLRVPARRATWSRVHQWSADRFYRLAVRMRGGLIKIGQLISVRVDVAPVEWTRTLSKLQDKVDPLPWSDVEGRLTSELGTPPDELFATIEHEARNAASFGQVHRARTKDGQDVALKVKYADVERQLAVDLGLMRRVVPLFNIFVPKVGLRVIADEMSKALTAELDYEQEARFTQTIHRNLVGLPNVVIPRVLPEYTTRNVICTTWFEGHKITDRAKVDELGVDIHELMRRITHAFTHMVFVDGVFQSDPHPGNILFRGEGGQPEVCILDFGQVKELPAAFQDKMLTASFAYMVRDVEGFMRAVVDMGVMSERDMSQAKPLIVEFFDKYFEMSPADAKQLDFDKIKADVQGVVGRIENVTIPQDIILYGRMFGLLAGVFTALDDRINGLILAQPIIMECLMKSKMAKMSAAT